MCPPFENLTDLPLLRTLFAFGTSVLFENETYSYIHAVLEVPISGGLDALNEAEQNGINWTSNPDPIGSIIIFSPTVAVFQFLI